MEAIKRHSENAMKLQRVGLPQKQVDALSELTHSTVEVAVQPVVQRLDGLENSMEVRFSEAEKSINARFEAAEKSINARFEAAEKSINVRFEAAEKSINARFEAAEKSNKAHFAEVHSRLDVLTELIAENGRQIGRMRSEIRSDRRLLIFASLALFSASIAMVGMAARLFVQ